MTRRPSPTSVARRPYPGFRSRVASRARRRRLALDAPSQRTSRLFARAAKETFAPLRSTLVLELNRTPRHAAITGVVAVIVIANMSNVRFAKSAARGARARVDRRESSESFFSRERRRSCGRPCARACGRVTRPRARGRARGFGRTRGIYHASRRAPVPRSRVPAPLKPIKRCAFAQRVVVVVVVVVVVIMSRAALAPALALDARRARVRARVDGARARRVARAGVEDETNFAPIDADSDDAPGGVASGRFGPECVLCVGFAREEVRAWREVLDGIGADFVRVNACEKRMLARPLGRALEATQGDASAVAPALGVPRMMFLSGMSSTEVLEVIEVYRDEAESRGWAPCVFACAVPKNYESEVSSLLAEIMDDHERLTGGASCPMN